MEKTPSLVAKVTRTAFVVAACFAVALSLAAQSIRLPWSGFAHTPQHDCISPVPSQPLNRIKWSAPVVLGVPNEYTHFSGPLVSRSNTVIFPLNLTNVGYNFKLEAVAGATGQTNWEQPMDYVYMAVSAQPPFPLALTPRNRLYVAAAGGTVLYCDAPDAGTLPTFERAAFYGIGNYYTNTNGFNSSVYISTPITSDRYGDIFFGFQVSGASPLGNQGGIARIDFNGSGSWISATNVSTNISGPLLNCAPALSQDQKTVYDIFTGNTALYIAALDSRTLAPLTTVSLKDPLTRNNARTLSISTASPTVGPDGDVYYGIEGTTTQGWLLHFDSSLTVQKIPGGFGWDVTDSIVDASLVPSYTGNSKYLLATKYNNYDSRQYSMAILDPGQGTVDLSTRVTIMATVLTVPSPAGLEWCVNSATVDPFTKSVIANNEDGNLYRWDLTLNQLTEKLALTTTQSGEAYTPTVVGVDGAVYAINHGYLFAVGQ